MGPDTARARNRLSLVAAHRAGSRGWRKDAEIPLKSKIPALHREAERDTTGSNSRQLPVHTWNGPVVQGRRRCAATVTAIHRKAFKLQLTLWFYCGKRAARRHGFVGEPRKSSCFAGIRARVRRSVAVRGRRPGRHCEGPV